MRRFSLFSMLPLVSILLTISGIPKMSPTRKGIAVYLPTSGELKPWKSIGSREVYKGEALYLWIDGGASIYLEYGFEQAVTEQYVNPDSQTITLELYQMKDPPSAYGMYTFKKNAGGSPAAVGSEGWMEEYYLSFWKGSHLVTLVASDPDDRLMKDLLTIAKIVAKKIPDGGSRPSLIDLLPPENLDSATIRYLQGPLALLNTYSFGGDNIFSLKKGVVGDYGDTRFLILEYSDVDESLARFNSSAQYLREEGEYRTAEDRAGLLFLVDSKGQQIHLKPHQEYILIHIGPEGATPATLFDAAEETIEHSDSSEGR